MYIDNVFCKSLAREGLLLSVGAKLLLPAHVFLLPFYLQIISFDLFILFYFLYNVILFCTFEAFRPDAFYPARSGFSSKCIVVSYA